MDVKSLQDSIRELVKQQGERLTRLSPKLIAISLSSAALIPVVLESLSGTSAITSSGIVLLYDLGVAAIAEIISNFASSLQEKYSKSEPNATEIKELLEKELLQVWDSESENSQMLRKDASVLLHSIEGIDVALNSATKDIKQALAQNLGDLGNEFLEFRWILDEIKSILIEIQMAQAIQLATQKEQLEIQREQLVKTNVLLRLQQRRETEVKPVKGQIDSGETLPPADLPCPYRGLAAYQPEDSDYFFGREGLVAELIARLAGSQFLGIVGPSGSGKSSVVRAGLIPAIWKNEIRGSENWKTIIFTPGQHPLEELAVRISLIQGVSPGALLQDLKNDTANLNLAVKQAFLDQPDDARLGLFVDQCEELFTLCHDEQERADFINTFVNIAKSPNNQITGIISLRADYYGHCSSYPEFSSLLSDNQMLVGAMGQEDLRRAITSPANEAGLQIEPGLVEMILREIAEEPGALPMLSHALMETWKRRSGNKMTVQGYLDSGGVVGAITETAEAVYQHLSSEQQILVRNIFMQLTGLGEVQEPTSRRSKITDLTSNIGIA